MKKFTLLLLILLATSISSTFANTSSYYAQGVAKLSSQSPTGSGTVYVTHVAKGTAAPSDPADSDYGTSKSDKSDDASGATYDYYFYAKASDDYTFQGWSETDGNSDLGNTIPTKVQITAPTSDGTTTKTLYALFVKKVEAGLTFIGAENGTYTVNGSTPPTSLTTEDAVSLVATPASGYKILGWYTTDDNGVTKKYFSTSANVSQAFTSSTSIGVDFVPTTTPIFIIRGSLTPYTDLNVANATANGGIIVLVSDGILPAGNYVISSGNTLLIPYDDNYTCVAKEPSVTHNSYTTPSVYRTLTLEKDAEINVQGNISVSAQQFAGQTSGVVYGKYGYIKMSEGSNII